MLSILYRKSMVLGKYSSIQPALNQRINLPFEVFQNREHLSIFLNIKRLPFYPSSERKYLSLFLNRKINFK